MTGRTRKLGTIVAVAATATLAFSAVGAHASSAAKDADDHYSPANTQVSGHSSSTTFTVGGVITVTCTNSDAGGHTPATGLGAFAISPLPTFNDGGTAPCTDNFGGTDTTVTKGAWKLQMKDAAGDETQTEPNSGDTLRVTGPKE